MAREYIVEEVRVTGGSMRLRDSLTGELVDVSITPGAAFTPPKPADRRETGASARAPAPAPAEELPAASKTVTTSADESDARPAEKRKRKKRKKTEGRQGSSPEPEAAGSGVDASTIGTAPMTTQESREIVIDESTLTEDDKAVLAKVRSVLVKSRRNNKRGELGWKEITVDGRSGVMARWGKGQFKILHAGDDTYALFYEWDGGKWQQVACGSAEDLMHIAARRAREEVPTAPLTTLTLEMARYMCGTPAQRAAARERLAPVLAETDKPLVKLPDIDLTGKKINVVKPTSPEPAATTADDVNPDLDEKIGGSLKKILEDM